MSPPNCKQGNCYSNQSAMAPRALLLRRLSGFLKASTSLSSTYSSSSPLQTARFLLVEASEPHVSPRSTASRNFCSRSLNIEDEYQGPAAIDYRSLLQEDEFHRLADSTIHDLQEKFEVYGDTVQIDGFDIDYGNEVLTLKFGDLGTYVLNKQTPNRQIWLSSPVSGPSRFDWDRNEKAWVYRRNRANLLKILEGELGELCGKSIVLS
ncbi:putative Frataxin, mitochondrial [Quillaja saponaria]|uniref:ferroxidase n=1 Tax=Quillaja saponaria TaxID=32244 RepID=A0AAD7QH24_QUISA|nr:putative Frataxin, mitochondrial [Quillaja saponaria]